MHLVFLLIITCLTLTSAVSDSERVEVKRGENVKLSIETPVSVRRATLKHCENTTGEPIIRYCSPEEEKRGCTAMLSERLSFNDTGNLSVNFADARASDEGCYVVSYIDGANVLKEKLFNVTVHGSLENAEDFSVKVKETPGTISRGYWIIIAVVIILAIIGVISFIINCQKRRQGNAGGAPENLPLNSTSTEAGTPTAVSIKMEDETECSLDNDNQQEEGTEDLNHDDRKTMTDRTGRTRDCVDRG